LHSAIRVGQHGMRLDDVAEICSGVRAGVIWMGAPYRIAIGRANSRRSGVSGNP
jgi:hypothetical protein